MSERFEQLSDKHIQFIKNQHLYFIGTAASEGHINVSPKGMDSFRVINNTTVTWLNLTGSGNETAAHIIENPRMTVMFCSFDKQPLILRLYGKATVHHTRDERWNELYSLFPESPGARQVFELKIDLVQTSCGYAVPLYDLKSERPTLAKWADKKTSDEIAGYWKEKNAISLDGKETAIFER